MSISGCPHGPTEITGGPDACPVCLKERKAAQKGLEHTQRMLQLLEHKEHIERRLADGWYALHTCQECKREFNSPVCSHSHVVRHDYHSETWWQCEDCEIKFTPQNSDREKAAGELLKAARAVSSFFVYLESWKGEGARDSLNQLRQAIAKAEQAYFNVDSVGDRDSLE